MEQAAFILAGSILIALAVVIGIVGLIVVNNLMATYWKPVKWVKYEYKTVKIHYNVDTGEYVKADPVQSDRVEPTIEMPTPREKV